MTARLTVLLALCYPLAVHVGITRGTPLMALGLFAVLVLLASWQGLDARHRSLLGLALAAGLAGAAMLNGAGLLLYTLPVFIQTSLALVFYRSLRPGSTPLITRYALVMDARDTPEVRRYTRAVTVAWALLCAALAVTSTLLALFAPAAVWSLFANALSYLLLATLFALEFPVRRWVLGEQTRPGFLRYLLQLARVDHRQVLRCP